MLGIFFVHIFYFSLDKQLFCMSPCIAPIISTYVYTFSSNYRITIYCYIIYCGNMLTRIFIYSGDDSLLLRYMFLMTNHPNLDPGVDMTLFKRILVVSDPDVSILFLTSCSNLFPPAVSLTLLGSSFYRSVSTTKLAHVSVLCVW